MKAAETSASIATADCTPLTVVSRSSTTAEMETFMNDVSITNTNIAAARNMPVNRLRPVSVDPIRRAYAPRHRRHHLVRTMRLLVPLRRSTQPSKGETMWWGIGIGGGILYLIFLFTL